MPSLDSLTSVVHKLRLATSILDIGQALSGAAQAFGFEQLAIAEPGSVKRQSVLYATTLIADRTVDSSLESARNFELPFFVTAPPDHSDGEYNAAVIIPIHEHKQFVWCVCALGVAPDLSSRAKLLLGAAGYAAYARHQGLAKHKKSLDWGLSARERECLDFVLLGKTDAEIGQILKISPRTVRFHVHNGKAKLGVTTRVQAVAKLSALPH